ncbi:MAG: sugar ABC transporter permease [Candidatus Rokubacteria bacterium]|nr:sugar ABC transporter permease [Candidatus Rokubacteria bacterium]
MFVLYRIIPLAWNGVLSFQKWSPFKPAEWAGLFHYEEMLIYDDVFWKSLWNTIVFMSSSPLAIGLALGIALLVNSPIRGRALYRAAVFLSYPLMTVAVGIIWRWLYDEKVGLINYVLIWLGVIGKGIPFLESADWAMPAVIVAAIWQIVGFFMIILLAGLQNIPQELHEAAAIDGASDRQRFGRITLPLLRPSIFLCLIIGIISSFTSFDLIYVMTRGGPNYSTELLITYIYRVAFSLSKLDYAAALTVVLFLFLLSLTWLANRLSGGEAGAVEATE